MSTTTYFENLKAASIFKSGSLFGRGKDESVLMDNGEDSVVVKGGLKDGNSLAYWLLASWLKPIGRFLTEPFTKNPPQWLKNTGIGLIATLAAVIAIPTEIVGAVVAGIQRLFKMEIKADFYQKQLQRNHAPEKSVQKPGSGTFEASQGREFDNVVEEGNKAEEAKSKAIKNDKTDESVRPQAQESKPSSPVENEAVDPADAFMSDAEDGISEAESVHAEEDMVELSEPLDSTENGYEADVEDGERASPEANDRAIQIHEPKDKSKPADETVPASSPQTGIEPKSVVTGFANPHYNPQVQNDDDDDKLLKIGDQNTENQVKEKPAAFQPQLTAKKMLGGVKGFFSKVASEFGAGLQDLKADLKDITGNAKKSQQPVTNSDSNKENVSDAQNRAAELPVANHDVHIVNNRVENGGDSVTKSPAPVTLSKEHSGSSSSLMEPIDLGTDLAAQDALAPEERRQNGNSPRK